MSKHRALADPCNTTLTNLHLIYANAPLRQCLPRTLQERARRSAKIVPELAAFLQGMATAAEGGRDGLLFDPAIRYAISRLLEIDQGADLDEEEPDPARFLAACAARPIGREEDEPTEMESIELVPGRTSLRLRTPAFAETAGGQYLDAIFRARLGRKLHFRPVMLQSADHRQHDNLRSGARLLHDLMPDVAAMIALSARGATVMDYARPHDREIQKQRDFNINLMSHDVPGMLFLSPPSFKNPLAAAEALLREGLSRCLSDLDTIEPIAMRPPDEGDTIEIIWNRSYMWRLSSKNPNAWAHTAWTVERGFRALTAFVYLARFFQAVQAQEQALTNCYEVDVPADLERERQACMRKAAFLVRELDGGAQGSLGPGARRTVAWLRNSLLDMDAGALDIPPDLDLYLERYDNDTEEVTSIIEHIPDDLALTGDWTETAPEEEWPLLRLVNQLIQNEVAAGHTLLSAIHGDGSAANAGGTAERARWSAQASVHLPFPRLSETFFNQRDYVSAMLKAAAARAGGGSEMPQWRQAAIAYLTSDINDYSIKCIPLLAVRKKSLMG